MGTRGTEQLLCVLILFSTVALSISAYGSENRLGKRPLLGYEILKKIPVLMNRYIDLHNSLRKRSLADLRFSEYMATLNRKQKGCKSDHCSLHQLLSRYGRR